jgi:hypothetical protein
MAHPIPAAAVDNSEAAQLRRHLTRTLVEAEGLRDSVRALARRISKLEDALRALNVDPESVAA